MSDSGPPMDYNPVLFPPLVSKNVPKDSWKVPQRCRHLNLPLRCTLEPNSVTAKATLHLAEWLEDALRS
jgi:hypothetical protein